MSIFLMRTVEYTLRIHGTGIFTCIYHKNQPNVGKYTIHGSLGIYREALRVAIFVISSENPVQLDS